METIGIKKKMKKKEIAVDLNLKIQLMGTFTLSPEQLWDLLNFSLYINDFI